MMINDLKSRTSSGISITSCIHPVIQLWNLGSVIAEKESFETMHLRKMFPILYKEHKMNKYMRSLIKMLVGPWDTTSIKKEIMETGWFRHVSKNVTIMQSTVKGGCSRRLLTSTTWPGYLSYIFSWRLTRECLGYSQSLQCLFTTSDV